MFIVKKERKQLGYWTKAAMIAAIYALLTIVLAPISYGVIQVRVSEMLTILPFFTVAAVPGLFVGCLIANIVGGHGILDIVFGSLASLLSALLVARIKIKYLVPLPPVIINALVVGVVLHYVLDFPLHLAILWVGAGQIIACYGLGYPLLLFLEKRREIFD
ncbi:MAG TPA: QueT transporter family protein [Candidatus Limnocylindrales bacterium]|nr:QueT transporter family protein [Candidatus Limnocylindrales bacterium]